jgi:hypothetical protein
MVMLTPVSDGFDGSTMGTMRMPSSQLDRLRMGCEEVCKRVKREPKGTYLIEGRGGGVEYDEAGIGLLAVGNVITHAQDEMVACTIEVSDVAKGNVAAADDAFDQGAVLEVD